MKMSYKGTSPLARITDGLPVRARIGVVLAVADLAISRLDASANFPIARSAFDLCRRWYDGERLDPARLADAYADEDGGGVVHGAIEARSQLELAAWGASQARSCILHFKRTVSPGALQHLVF
jgi:hypothetical protein